MRAAFIIPAFPPRLGADYDHRMIHALRAAGHSIEIVEAGTDWAERLPADAVPVIDGLAMAALDGIEAGLAGRAAIGLVAHPSDAIGPAVRLMSRVVAPSRFVAEHLVGKSGVETGRVVVIAPGTDDAARSTGSGGPGCVILAVGDLVRRKGHDVLIRALARLFDLDWHLTIIGARGDAAHAAELAALVAELGVTERVRFAGTVGGQELEALWRQADIFALATRHESYGTSIAEALRRGLPVAITSGGAAATLTSATSGIACEPDDVVTFSKAMRRLIFDVKLRAASADAAWEIGRTLPHWSTQARRLAEEISAL